MQAGSYLTWVLCIVSLPALSYESGDILLRAGYANVDFRERSNPVLVDDTFDVGDLSVASQREPLLTFAVMFSEQWGVEFLIPFLPLELKADGKGGIIDGLPMGTADVYPLMVAFQYYPFETGWARPYLGIGGNYTFINNEKVNNNTASLLGIDSIESLDADNSVGWVLQLGVDFPVSKNCMINLSTMYLELNLNASGTFYADGVLSDISAKMGLKMAPNVTVLGISYRF